MSRVIHREFSKNGWLITTRAARILPWGQACLNHQKALRCWKSQVTEVRLVTEWWGVLSWAGLHHEYRLENLAV
jgi:hypothetical protein